jgi:hypothetical protein
MSGYCPRCSDWYRGEWITHLPFCTLAESETTETVITADDFLDGVLALHWNADGLCNWCTRQFPCDAVEAAERAKQVEEEVERLERETGRLRGFLISGLTRDALVDSWEDEAGTQADRAIKAEEAAVTAIRALLFYADYAIYFHQGFNEFANEPGTDLTPRAKAVLAALPPDLIEKARQQP